MTKNEAKAYIADEQNWHVIGVTDYARVAKLEYKTISYIAIQTKHLSMAEWYRYKEVVEEWHNSLYFVYDREHDCLGFSTRPTHMANEIWEESMK